MNVLRTQVIKRIPLNKDKLKNRENFVNTPCNTKKTNTFNLEDIKKSQYPILYYFDGIGDAIIALPTIRAICNYFSGKLSIICSFFPEPWWLYDLPLKQIILAETIVTEDNLIFDSRAIVEAAGPCDLCFAVSIRTNDILNHLERLLSPDFIIGLGYNYDISVPINPKINYGLTAFKLAKTLANIEYDSYIYPPSIPVSAEILSDKILQYLLKEANWPSYILAVHCDTQAEKMWSKEKFQMLLIKFLSIHKNWLVVILGASSFLDKIHPKVIDLTGLTFDLSISLLSKANLFLGIDSCCLHFADIFRVPSIGLYGPSSHDLYGFQFTKHKYILGNGSMENIEIEMVLEALNEFSPK